MCSYLQFKNKLKLNILLIFDAFAVKQEIIFHKTQYQFKLTLNPTI